MAGKLDGRTLSGARKALGRMRAGEGEESMEVALLSNVIKLAESAENLTPDRIKSTPLSELQPHIDKMIQENVMWPEAVQTALVTKRLQGAIGSKNWSSVVDICTPWRSDAQTAAFDPNDPRVATCGEKLVSKVQLFNNVVFEKVLIPLIRGGPDSVDEVVGLATHCCEAYRDVDLLEADNVIAAALDEWYTIWHSLIAMGSKGLHSESKDCSANDAHRKLSCSQLMF
eukprot:2082738-Pyramimonas_sp.AAC.1